MKETEKRLEALNSQSALARERPGTSWTLAEMQRQVLERAAPLLPRLTGAAVLVRELDDGYRCSAMVGEGPWQTGRRLSSQEVWEEAPETGPQFRTLRWGAKGAPRHSLMVVPLPFPAAPAPAEPGPRAPAALPPPAALHLLSAASVRTLAGAAPLAELIGAQLTLTAQRTELAAAAQRAERELALLERMRDALACAESPVELFGGLVASVREVMGYEHVHIGLLEGDELVSPVLDAPLLRFPVSWGVVGRVLRTRQAQLVSDVRLDSDYVAALPDVVSELCVPLWDGEQCVGVLDVETVSRPLTGEDLGLMITLGEWLGRAIERERLYRATARQRQELDLLHRVRTALGREEDTGGVIRAVDEALVQLLNYTHVSVYLRQGEELVMQHQIGYPQVIERLPLSQGVMGRVARSGQAVWLEDVNSDQGSLKAFASIASEVCVPLRQGDEVVGVLNVETVGDVRLTSDDLRLIEMVGEYVSYALERAALSTQLREREELYRLLAEHTRDLVCLHHPDGTFAYVSPSVRALLGHDPAQLVGTHPMELLHPKEQHLLGKLASWQDLTRGGPLRFRLRAAPERERSERFVWFETSVSAVPGSGGAGYFVTSSRDVTQRLHIERQLARDALTDPLTGLPNRRGLLAALERMIRRVRNGGSPAYAVLYLDMDRFKVVNDSLGHSVGDELLQTFAQRLRGAALPGSLVARLGGDEFAVLVTGPASFEVARNLVTRLHAALDAPFEVAGHRLQVAVSVGIAPGRAEYRSATEVLRDADLSMYRSKRARNVAYTVFDPSMHADALRQLELEAALPVALAAGAFSLNYQPLVHLNTGAWLGFEALARWTHPTLGDISPTEFIALAEETGLIAELGSWVLREACRWRAALPGPGCSVHVNVSPRQFLLDSFAADVQEILKENATPPQALHLEVTESTFMENRAQAARTLGQLRALGVRVHIDDFGTGHSNLGFLHQFPVDALKVDRSFVARLGEDRVSSGVVQAVLALARTLGVKTVGEGIETEAQRQRLQWLGVDLGQGYLFSRPLSAEAARQAWLERTPPSCLADPADEKRGAGPTL